jgi:hypothetical protein
MRCSKVASLPLAATDSAAGQFTDSVGSLRTWSSQPVQEGQGRPVDRQLVAIEAAAHAVAITVR